MTFRKHRGLHFVSVMQLFGPTRRTHCRIKVVSSACEEHVTWVSCVKIALSTTNPGEVTD